MKRQTVRCLQPGCRDNLEYFARFVREHRSELATVLWKDTSPQHFGWENGHFWCAQSSPSAE